MRRRLFSLIVLCLVCFFLLCACDDSASSSKSNDETTAEYDGEYTAVTDDDGNITGYERKYHNDNGDITRWDVYDADEQYDHYIIYEYDSDNRLIQETCYRADGIGVYYYAYTYTDDGVIYAKDYVTMKGGSERILYDSDGSESEHITFDAEDNIAKYEVMQDGEWVEAELPTEPDDTTATAE